MVAAASSSHDCSAVSAALTDESRPVSEPPVMHMFHLRFRVRNTPLQVLMGAQLCGKQAGLRPKISGRSTCCIKGRFSLSWQGSEGKLLYILRV